MPKSEQAIGSSMCQIRILNNKFWVSVLFVEGAVCPKVSKQSGQSTFHSDGLNDGIVCFFRHVRGSLDRSDVAEQMACVYVVLFLVVADCQRWCVGVCGGGVFSVKFDHWDFERCRIHTLGWALCWLNCLGRSPSADSMRLGRFYFWWLPVVGLVCLGVCWWRAKFQ